MTTTEILKKLIRINMRIEEDIKQLKAELAASKSPWLGIKDAAAYVGLSEGYFYQIYKSELPYSQRGAKIMFHIDDLDTWLKHNQKSPVRIPV